MAPTIMVTMLLASWMRRRVLRNRKKLFQSSFGSGGEGVEDEEEEGEGLDADVDGGTDAVLALRRAANWHCTGIVVFRLVVVDRESFVSRGREDTRALGCRASDANDDAGIVV